MRGTTSAAMFLLPWKQVMGRSYLLLLMDQGANVDVKDKHANRTLIYVVIR